MTTSDDWKAENNTTTRPHTSSRMTQRRGPSTLLRSRTCLSYVLLSVYVAAMYVTYQYFVLDISIAEPAERKDVPIHNHFIMETEPSCSPENTILLAKTHKTGSSTIGTIIARYGYNRNLSFALPAKDWIIGYDLFSPEMLLRKPPPGGFDILFNHVLFRKNEMAKVMNPRTKYVTILREPVSRWYSTVEYYNLWKLVTHTQSEYEQRSSRFDIHELLSKIARCISFHCRLGQDGQLFDLGFQGRTTVMGKLDPVRAKIEELRTEFDLVLIVEYFDESLLLLKKMMCWDYNDILYIKKKQSRRRRTKHQGETEAIRIWNRGDILLYEHFNRTLWERIADYGPDFEDDLRHFRTMNADVTSACKAQIPKYSVSNQSYDYVNMTCLKLTVDVSKYTMTLVDIASRYKS